jgi:hypothetical protein
MNSRLLCLAALFPILALAVAGCTVMYTEPPGPAYVEPAPPPPPPEQDFYDLNAYGEWIDVYPFGTVWRPYVASDWGPYLYGHWVWSEWGWTWVSYEPFGWAVYHYGYWRYTPAWGWLWIPGHEWEPVRVRWLWYDDYVCWAPLPPPGYELPDPWLTHSTDVWVVVYSRDFTNYDLHRFRVKAPRYKDRFDSTVKVHREPPRVAEIERQTRKTVPHVELHTRSYESGTKTYKRIVLPESERKVVSQYEPTAKKRLTAREKTAPEATNNKGGRATTDSGKQPQQKEKTKSTTKTKPSSSKKTKAKSQDKGSGKSSPHRR